MIIGPLGPTQLSCLASWRAQGLQSVFVQTEGPKPWGIGNLASVHLHRSIQSLRTESGIHWLREQICAHRVSGVTCVGDELALSLHEALAPLANVGRWLAPAQAIRSLMSKCLQVERAAACGFEVLPTWEICSLADADRLPRSAFPLVVRPDTPQSVRPGFKVELWNDVEQAKRFIGQRECVSSPMIAQRFVKGPNILIHGHRSNDGSRQGFSAFLVPRKHLGVAVELLPWQLPSGLEQACSKFASAFSLQGVFHFDLLLDESDGKVYFMEVNARLGGTTGKVSALGLNEPAQLLSAFGALPPLPATSTSARRAYNLQAALKYWWSACRGDLSLLDFPCAGPIEATWALLRLLVRGREEIGLTRQPGAAIAYHSQKVASLWSTRAVR